MEKSARTQPLNLKHRCNSQKEIDAALAEGFDGVEIDLVWCGEYMILCHNHGGDVGPALHDVDFRNCVVAVNVKEYGMYPHLNLPTARDWFVFDVPGAELDLYCMAGVRVFGRYSMWEDQTVSGQCSGALLDDFTASVPGQTALFYKFVRTPSESLPVALISNQLRGGRDSDFVASHAKYIIRKTLP